MKKVFNKTWIAILAVFAIVVGACCSHKNAPKENNDPNNQESNEHKMTKKELQERIAQIREALKKREMACVYGSPEVIENYSRETMRMRQEADSLQNILDNYGKKP